MPGAGGEPDCGGVDPHPGQADVWESAVTRGDVTQLSNLVRDWSGSKTDVALTLLRSCVAFLEKDLEDRGVDSVPSRSPTAPQCPTRDPCLDALIVVLNQDYQGKSWFASTQELQLASLSFCRACRSIATPILRVDGETPSTLLTPAVGRAPSPEESGPCSMRVPPLRARRVNWRLPTAARLRSPIHALTDAVELHFAREFVDTFEDIVWPRRLLRLTFAYGPRFNQPTCGVGWPPSLQRLAFGDAFDQALDRIGWPASLRELSLGNEFNQSLEGMLLPPSMERLAFGDGFDQPIEGVRWPPLLTHLSFGGYFNQPIRGVRWPPSLKQLVLGGCFNQPLDGVEWPALLEEITLGEDFVQPIDRVTWPASLQQITFGKLFNLPIEGVAWPASLLRLTLGWYFDQPVDGVAWPENMQELAFGHVFNQPVEGVVLPASLQRLTFDFCFNQPVEGLALPQSLQSVTFGHGFNQPIAGVKWPDSITHLSFGESFNHPMEQVLWPALLQDLRVGGSPEFARNKRMDFRSSFNQTIDGALWPPSLRRLTLGGDFEQSLRGLGTWIPDLQELRVFQKRSADRRLLADIEWPMGLRRLTVFKHSQSDEVKVPSTVEVTFRTVKETYSANFW